MENGTKSRLQSKSMWGGVVSLVATLLAASGVLNYDTVLLLIDQLLAAAGALWGMYGREVAQDKLV